MAFCQELPAKFIGAENFFKKIPQEIKISNMFCFKISRARSSSGVN